MFFIARSFASGSTETDRYFNREIQIPEHPASQVKFYERNM
ncbi:uncharacterized protein METZ01_LOCUS251499, partial [marine metagenome]